MTVTGAQTYTVNYAYDLDNRLLAEGRRGVNQHTTRSTYDNNGNQLTSVTVFETETRTYNAFNQLTQVSRPGMTVDYTYRPDGLRLSKSMGNITTTHVWDGGHIVAERNQAGGVMNRFDRGAGQRVIRSEHHGFYLYNARGDVVQRANAAGVITHSYRYTAFGNELAGNQSANEASTNPWRFASMYWDAHTQTYYTPNRRLNPRTGRWLSPDPFWNIKNMQRSSAAITQSGNLFMYTMHNPVRWVDPTGLFAMPPGLGLGNTLGVLTTLSRIRGSAVSNAFAAANTSTPTPYTSSGPDSDGDSFITQAERNLGVTTINIGGIIYRDLSVPVNAMLTNNANEARAQRGRGPIVIKTPLLPIVSRLSPSDYLWIVQNFAAGHRWDFKDQDSWERQFQDIPFHGENGLFVVNGVVMKPADLGNVNFGYVTSALGVSTLVQLAGAGVAHIRDHGLYHVENLLHFGDSPRCRYFTDMGRYWYRHGRIR